jgi:uncharacterized protein YjbI with pentapeptide repeats
MHMEISRDLSGADLASMDLTTTDLNGLDLPQAEWTGATLRVRLDGADLRGTTLRDADMSGAFGPAADFTGADLGDVDDADLPEASPTGAHLTDAALAERGLPALSELLSVLSMVLTPPSGSRLSKGRSRGG